MICIYRKEDYMVISIDQNYNSKANQLIELLAIKYFADRKYDVKNKDTFTIFYAFKNNLLNDDLFFTTILGNLLNTGLSICKKENDLIYMKNEI